jgi:heme exporter protein B
LWFNVFIISSPALFCLLLILSFTGLASASTLLGALISKAGAKNSLFAVVSFPVMLPLLLISVDVTKACLSGTSFVAVSGSLGLLTCYDGIIITVSYMLFKYVWED